MGMNLDELEQEAFEAGWEAALVAAAVVVQRSATGISAHVFQQIEDLAGNPPKLSDVDQ